MTQVYTVRRSTRIWDDQNNFFYKIFLNDQNEICVRFREVFGAPINPDTAEETKELFFSPTMARLVAEAMLEHATRFLKIDDPDDLGEEDENYRYEDVGEI
jgi:hypothetical protein